MNHYTTFETDIGTCALGWRGEVITRMVLPVGAGEDVAWRIRRGSPDARPATPPDWVRRAMTRMSAHLAGELDDLQDIPVVLAEGTFDRRVYALTRAILPGRTRTYGELATEAGDATQARAVGQAMARNPVPLIVPCHRVLGAGGALGGFSAPGGTDTKRRMLSIERAAAVAQLGIFDPAQAANR